MKGVSATKPSPRNGLASEPPPFLLLPLLRSSFPGMSISCDVILSFVSDVARLDLVAHSEGRGCLVGA